MKQQFKFLKMLGLERVYRVDECIDIDAPDYQQLLCGRELGGIIAVGLIKPGTDIGSTVAEIQSFLESEVSWSNGIGDSPQNMWVIQRTKGSLPAGTSTETDGWGLESTSFEGMDRELSFEAQGIMQNYDFVSAVNKRRGWGLVYVTAGYDSANDGYEAFYAKNVSVIMSEVIEQSIKSEKRWQGTAKWSTDGTPSIPFIAPSSIFTNQ